MNIGSFLGKKMTPLTICILNIGQEKWLIVNSENIILGEPTLG